MQYDHLKFYSNSSSLANSGAVTLGGESLIPTVNINLGTLSSPNNGNEMETILNNAGLQHAQIMDYLKSLPADIKVSQFVYSLPYPSSQWIRPQRHTICQSLGDFRRYTKRA